MASGSVMNPNWVSPPRQLLVDKYNAALAAQQNNTAQALAPTQAAGPLGSSFGLGLPAGYASALTQYLDPAAMEAKIREDAQVAAGNAAADRGFGLGDNIGARLTGEIQAPALQAFRTNLLNQIPQFWQMEQAQRQDAEARADREREHQWQLEDRSYEKKQRDDAARQYRNSLASTGTPFDSTYGLFGGYNPSGAPQGGGGGGGGANVTGSADPRSGGYGQPGSLASHRAPMFPSSSSGSGIAPGGGALVGNSSPPGGGGGGGTPSAIPSSNPYSNVGAGLTSAQNATQNYGSGQAVKSAGAAAGSWWKK